MNYKLLAYAALPLASLAFLGVSAASAHGMFGGFKFGGNLTPDEIAGRAQARFQQEAQIFGVSLDDLKAGWAEGKSPAQVALDKGQTKEQIQTRLQAARSAQLKTQMQALVDKGVITQAQADKRLQTTQNSAQKSLGGMMGRHRWFGW